MIPTIDDLSVQKKTRSSCGVTWKPFRAPDRCRVFLDVEAQQHNGDIHVAWKRFEVAYPQDGGLSFDVSYDVASWRVLAWCELEVASPIAMATSDS